MSKLIEKIPCTSPICGSSDGMQVYQQDDGSYDATCFVCNYYDRNPYGNNEPKQREEYKPAMNTSSVYDISLYSSDALTDRRLHKETLEYFGVKVDYNETDRSIKSHYYPIIDNGGIIGYKKRTVLTKEFTSIGDGKRGELFGEWQSKQIQDNRKLFITEGEIDAMALWQVLVDQNRGTQWSHLIPSVVSIRNGASGADKELAKHAEFLSNFNEIVLVFDNDEAGQEGVEKASKVLPIDKIKIVKLPLKDAGEMLAKGREKELHRAVVFNAVSYKPVTVVGVEDVIEKALIPPTMGMPWQWPTLNSHTYGRHTGNLYGVGGGVGIGKSTFWFSQCGFDMKHNLGKHGLFFFEEAPEDALNLLAGQVFAKTFNDPTVDITEEDRRAFLTKLKDHVYFCDHSNMLLGSKDSWNEIVQAIKHMAIVEECKHITLDPLTALTSQMSASEANEFLNAALAQLAGLAKQLNICVYYGSHLNKPDKGKPHEEGGRVHLSQFTGSRAMIRWSQYIIGLERDNQNEDESVANTTWCRLLKIRRRFKKEQCMFPIFYNHTDGSFLEISKEQAGLPPSERSTKQAVSGGLNYDAQESAY